MRLSKIIILISLFFASEFIVLSDAYARRGFRSRMSRSWGSKSRKSPWGVNKSRTNDRTRKSKSNWGSRTSRVKSNKGTPSTSSRAVKTTKPASYQKTSFQRKMSNKVSQKQANKAFKDYKSEQKQYKPLKSNNKSIRSHSMFKRFKSKGNYDRRSYYARRNNHYGGYRSPYLYRSYSSFGIWDGMMMWFIIDNLNQSRYRNMYYNHMNDEGFKKFRSEADTLAKNDQELKGKLDKLDQEMAQMKAKGIKQDPNYLPEGVDPDILLAGVALANLQPSINLCSGVKSGNYYYAADLMKQNSRLEINLIPTKGSKDNLEKIDNGVCDAAIVQKDALVEHNEKESHKSVNVLIDMYPEFGHLICKEEDEIKSIKDLSSRHMVSVGFEDSGSALTWNNLKVVNSSLSKVRVTYEGPSTGMMKLSQGKIDCVFSMNSLGTSFLDSNKLPGKVKLVNLDAGLHAFKDRNGDKIYEKGEIEAGAYPKLQHRSLLSKEATPTFYTRASLVVSDDWKIKNPEGIDQLSEVLLSVKPKIDDHVDPVK